MDIALVGTMDERNPFLAWIERHGMTRAAAAKALQISPNSVTKWCRKGAPHVVLLACMAFSKGLGPVE